MPKDPIRKCPSPDRGRLIALAVAVGLVLGMAGPTSAQFFNFGGYQQRPQPQRGGGWFGNEQRGGGWFGNDTYAPYQQQYAPPPRHGRQAPTAVREDFSKAPPPEKRNTVPERHILVLGDSMADWLAYGLEDVYADQPEMGVIRKHKTGSGLIKYQPKGNPADWAAAAKGILATEKADAIVVMLGLDDRVAIREPAADKADNEERRQGQTGWQRFRREARGEAGWCSQGGGSRIAAGRCRRQQWRAACRRSGEKRGLGERPA